MAPTISIIGKPKYCDKKAIRYATNFFLYNLMSKRLADSLSIRIVFDKDIIAKDLAFHDDGSCMYIINEEYGPPKEFELLIRPSLSRAWTYRVLSHECAHIDQYASGRYYQYERNPDRIRWKKGLYKQSYKTIQEYSKKP